jgi:hypothetical protein
MTRAEQKILPIFNRCAIFSSTSASYRSHPNALRCPLDRTLSHTSSTTIWDCCSLQVETHQSLNLIGVTSAAGVL